MISLHSWKAMEIREQGTDDIVCDSKQQLLEYGCWRLVRSYQVAPIFLRSYRVGRHGLLLHELEVVGSLAVCFSDIAMQVP